MPDSDLLLEKVTVLETLPGGLWVSGTRRSACGACALEKGCGQGLINRFGTGSVRLWVPFENGTQQRYLVGEEITIAVPAGAVARSSLQLYMLPLISMLVGLMCGAAMFSSEQAAVTGAVVGLLGGAGIIRAFRIRPTAVPRVYSRSESASVSSEASR